MGAKQLETNGECAVDLKILDAGQLALVLTLKAFSYLTAEYKFPLKAIEVDQKAILEAKMRDMEESLKGGLRPPVFISLKATAVTAPNQKVAWNVEYKSESAYFDLSSDTTTVNILKPGLYQVQLTGTKQGINSGNGVRLLVGGKTRVICCSPSNGFTISCRDFSRGESCGEDCIDCGMLRWPQSQCRLRA
ncbi:unnamed protein product [Aphanomyces euteiches]